MYMHQFPTNEMLFMNYHRGRKVLNIGGGQGSEYRGAKEEPNFSLAVN